MGRVPDTATDLSLETKKTVSIHFVAVTFVMKRCSVSIFVV